MYLQGDFRMKKQQLFITLAIVVMAIVLSACTGASAATRVSSGSGIPEITITAKDYGFEAPEELQAGLVTINLVNEGQEPHHAQLVRLNDGVTLEQFNAALQEGEAAAFPLVNFIGGPGLVDPGLANQVTVELTPGQYLVMCFVPSHDGVPHLAKGMIKPINVVAATEQANVARPKADATVKLLDFSFILPSEIKAGKQVWQVVNEGEQIHEIMFIKLAEGKSIADVQAFQKAPHGVPPFKSIGGFQALTPGQTGWLNLDLEPGDYVALCYVPDPASGHAHLELGMIMPFSVK